MYLGVVREDGASVEWTVVLRVVQPALGVVGVGAAQPEPDDVTGRIRQTLETE